MRTIDRCSENISPLEPLLSTLRELAAPLNDTQLREVLSTVSISSDEIRDAISFAADGYVRNLFHRDAMSELLILAWLDGQASPIHDHGTSWCGMRVLQGSALEVEYVKTEAGYLTPLSLDRFGPGTVTVCDRTSIHQIANESREPLLTLHLYSPPLSDSRLYHSSESVLTVPASPGLGAIAVGAR